jgi:glycosyltransferase involved in cell wall biosynthesis
MKVLIATGKYPPQTGSQAAYSKCLYDIMPKHGINTDVLSFGDFMSKPKGIRHFLYFKELLNRMDGVDIVYAQDPVSVGLPALFAAHIARKRFMVRIVGDHAWEQSIERFGVSDDVDSFSKSYLKHPIGAKILKKIEKYVADWADLIITPSVYLKGIITNWGVDASKITVVYDGFLKEDIKATTAALKKRLGLHGTVIVSAGRLVPRKGFLGLIEVFAKVKQRVPTAVLVIAGEGPDMEVLRAKVKELNLVEDVVLTGRIEQVLLFEYIKAADIFTLNTAYEGFSHLILEAMALGTPVVTTNVGGNPEIIDDNTTGILVEYDAHNEMANAIISLVQDPIKAQHVARDARAKVSAWTDAHMVAETSRIVLDVAEKNKK